MIVSPLFGSDDTFITRVGTQVKGRRLKRVYRKKGLDDSAWERYVDSDRVSEMATSTSALEHPRLSFKGSGKSVHGSKRVSTSLYWPINDPFNLGFNWVDAGSVQPSAKRGCHRNSQVRERQPRRSHSCRRSPFTGLHRRHRKFG